MYVCICNNVKESDIDQVIADGASSVTSIEQQLGVGSCCGQCRPRALEYINQQLPTPAARPANRSPDFNLKLKIARITAFNGVQAAQQ